jgi:putative FmdB family regulatory protein
MPTYDYECNACNHTFELFQSITAGHIRKCPECGELKVKRLIGTGSTIILKGLASIRLIIEAKNTNHARKLRNHLPPPQIPKIRKKIKREKSDKERCQRLNAVIVAKNLSIML